MDSSMRMPKDGFIQVPAGDQRIRRNAISDPSSSSIKSTTNAAERAGISKTNSNSINPKDNPTVVKVNRQSITPNNENSKILDKDKLNVMTKGVEEVNVTIKKPIGDQRIRRNAISNSSYSFIKIAVKKGEINSLKEKIMEKKSDLQEKMDIRERLSSINENTQKYNNAKLDDIKQMMSSKGSDKGKLQQIKELLKDYKDTFGVLWKETETQLRIGKELKDLGFSGSLATEDLVDAKIKENGSELFLIDNFIKEKAGSYKEILVDSENSKQELAEFDNEIKILELEINELENNLIVYETPIKQEAPAISPKKEMPKSETKNEGPPIDHKEANVLKTEITQEEAQNAKMMKTAQFVQSLPEDRLDRYMALSRNDREIFQALDEIGNSNKENEPFVEMLLQGLPDKSSKIESDNGKIFIVSNGGKANFLTSSGNIAGSSEIPKRLEIAVDSNGKLAFPNAEELSKTLKLSILMNSFDAKEIELFSKLTKDEKEVFQKFVELGKGDKANRLFTDMIFLGLKGKTPTMDLIKEGNKSFIVINSKGAKGVYEGLITVSCQIPTKIKIEIDGNGKFVLPKESLNLEVGWFKYNIGVKAGDDGRLSFDSNIKVFGFQDKINNSLERGHGLNTIFKGFGEELKWA